jgi:hypothetical protein
MEMINKEPQMFYPWTEPKGIMNIQHISTGWIDIDQNYLSSCQLKYSLLESNESTVFKSTSQSLDASKEVLQHVLVSLPSGVASCNENIVRNHLTEQSFDTNQTHPLKIASLLIQSDLCIMTEMNGDFILTDACVCFPDRWRIQDKIGKGLGGIHQPVKHFEKIRTATNAFMKGMTEPKYRFNYTFSPTDKLHLPHEMEGENTFLRVERQCFFRLNCGAILFTIRTYIQAISAMKDDVFPSLLDVLDGKETRTSLGNAKGKYEDVRAICCQRIQMEKHDWGCNVL